MLRADQARQIITEQVWVSVDAYMQELANLVLSASNNLERSIDYELPESEAVREVVLSRLDELGYDVVRDYSILTISW